MNAELRQSHRSFLQCLRPRFRLRSIFVLITLLSVWLGVSIIRKHREEAALEVITAAGGDWAMGFSWFYPFRSVHIVSFSGRDFTDTKLADVVDALSALPNLDYLQIVSSSVTDAGLIHIRDLDGISTLDLWGNSITDAGMEHLNGLRNLRHLDLSATLISDDSLARLAKMDGLQTLTLPPALALRPSAAQQPPAVLEVVRLLQESHSGPGVISTSAIKELKQGLPNCTIRQGNAYVTRPQRSLIPNPIPYEVR
jgi:hypothetical protein